MPSIPSQNINRSINRPGTGILLDLEFHLPLWMACNRGFSTLKFLIKPSKVSIRPAANVCKKGGQGQANRFTSWHANSTTAECDLRFSPDIKRQILRHAYNRSHVHVAFNDNRKFLRLHHLGQDSGGTKRRNSPMYFCLDKWRLLRLSTVNTYNSFTRKHAAARYHKAAKRLLNSNKKQFIYNGVLFK